MKHQAKEGGHTARFLQMTRFSLAFAACVVAGTLALAVHRTFITDAYGPTDFITALRRGLFGGFLYSAAILLPIALLLRKLGLESLTQFSATSGAVFFIMLFIFSPPSRGDPLLDRVQPFPASGRDPRFPAGSQNQPRP